MSGTVFEVNLISVYEMTHTNLDYHMAISDFRNFEIFKKYKKYKLKKLYFEILFPFKKMFFRQNLNICDIDYTHEHL